MDFPKIVDDVISRYIAQALFALTVLLLTFMHKRLWPVLRKRPAMEFTRRELLVHIAVCLGISLLMSLCIAAPLYVEPSFTPDPMPGMAWAFVVEAAACAALLSWGILKTPKEKQTSLLRYGAVLSSMLACSLFGAFGYIEVGQNAKLAGGAWFAVSLIVLGVLLVSLSLVVRRILKEQRIGAIKPFNWTWHDTFDVGMISLLGFMSLGTVTAWLGDVEQQRIPISTKLIGQVSGVTAAIAAVVFMLLLRHRKGRRKWLGCGVIAALLGWTFSGIWIFPNLREQEIPSDNVVAEARTHPNHVIAEVDGPVKDPNVSHTWVRGWWDVDASGQVKQRFVRNRDYVPQHKLITLYSYVPTSQPTTKPTATP